MPDYLLDVVYEHWDDILRAYKRFEEKKPIVLLDLQEQKVYVYPYEDFKNDMKPKSQASLKEQYEKAVRENQIVVFARDNEQRRLVSFSMDYEQKRRAGDPEFNDLSVPADAGTGGAASAANFTPRQGQFLTFIYYYTKLNGQAPAERDMERHFKITPPSVHQMVLTLEKRGLIQRTPGVGRSIRLLVSREQLPNLE